MFKVKYNTEERFSSIKCQYLLGVHVSSLVLMHHVPELHIFGQLIRHYFNEYLLWNILVSLLLKIFYTVIKTNMNSKSFNVVRSSRDIETTKIVKVYFTTAMF